MNIWNSCIIFMNLGEQSLCTFNATKRSGCTTVPEHRNLRILTEMQHEPHHTSSSWTGEIAVATQETHTHRVVKVIRSIARELQTLFVTRTVSIAAAPRTIGVGSKISFRWIGGTIIHLWTFTRPMIIRTTLETDLRTRWTITSS